MRTARLLLLTLCIASLLVGCRGDGRSSGADGRVTVTFWHSFVSSTIPALNELIEKFEAENPGIKINAQYIPSGDALVQKLITSVQSNTAPDVSWIHADFLEDLVKADAIYRMDHFMEGENGLSQTDLDQMYPALIQLSSWQGTLYSLPMEATNLGLVYNKDHFREAGLDPERPPQTWDELVDYANRLKLDRNGDGRYERVGFIVPIAPASSHLGPWMFWQFMPFVWQAGGDVITTDQTRTLFDEEGTQKALSLWKTLYDQQNLRAVSTSEALQPFSSKQASMILDGPWNLPRLPQVMGETKWGVAPLPAGPAGRATIVGGEYLAIFKQSEHPDAAWAFVKWITTPEVQAFWSMKSNYLPIRRDVLEIPEYRQFLDEHPGLKAFVESMEYARAQRPMDYFTLEITREIAEAIEQATTGGEDPRKVLLEANAASNKMLATVKRDSTLARR